MSVMEVDCGALFVYGSLLDEGRRVELAGDLEAQVLLELGVVALALQPLSGAAVGQLARRRELDGAARAGGLGAPTRLLGLLQAPLQAAQTLQRPAQGQARRVQVLDGVDVRQCRALRALWFGHSRRITAAC